MTNKLDKKDTIKVLIICYVPEIAESMTNVSNKIIKTFKNCIENNGKNIDLIDTIKCSDNNRSIKGLNNIANYLKQPNKKAIVYYYGHGDNVKDINGDESDNLDEKWTTQGILDDQISIIFNNIHITSRLYLFSDSCSSGSMIDIKLNNRPWVSISSGNDRQDSMATSDGGVFTMWGLIPGLVSLSNPTPIQLHTFIQNNLFFDTQTSIINCGDKKILNEKIF